MVKKPKNIKKYWFDEIGEYELDLEKMPYKNLLDELEAWEWDLKQVLKAKYPQEGNPETIIEIIKDCKEEIRRRNGKK